LERLRPPCKETDVNAPTQITVPLNNSNNANTGVMYCCSRTATSLWHDRRAKKCTVEHYATLYFSSIDNLRFMIDSLPGGLVPES
jgi:hypothetical protein